MVYTMDQSGENIDLPAYTIVSFRAWLVLVLLVLIDRLLLLLVVLVLIPVLRSSTSKLGTGG
jgi:hypothetical protein